jgi:hypothetical protein
MCGGSLTGFVAVSLVICISWIASLIVDFERQHLPVNVTPLLI